jgi:hypothetical protein
MKIKCKCKKVATWVYAPGSEPDISGRYADNTFPYFCDDCVPRECSCTKYEDTSIDDEGYLLDDKGCRIPYVGFWYEEGGFDED